MQRVRRPSQVQGLSRPGGVLLRKVRQIRRAMVSSCGHGCDQLVARGWSGAARTRNRDAPPFCQAPPGLLSHRYSSLDGLRGYLALAVFLSHSSIWYFYLHSGVWDVPPSTLYTQLGQSSVTLFFMITGLLFWSKLLNGRLEPIDWTRLYLSRVLRLGPLYLVAAACVILVAFCRAGFELKESPWVVVGQVATWLMFTIPGISPVNGFAETVPIAGAVWTLSYEWLFYACLPIGAFCLRASTPLPWLVFSAGAVTALTMGMPEVRMPMLSAFAGGITAASLSRIPAVRAMLARGVWGRSRWPAWRRPCSSCRRPTCGQPYCSWP